MACELADDTAWPAFLAARTLLASGATDLRFVRRNGGWGCVPADAPDVADAQQVLAASLHGDDASVPSSHGERAWTWYTPRADGVPAFEHAGGRPVDATLLSMARVYLPVLFGAARARADGRVFVAGHVTQTLDGRIACENGQSQWIGNDADLRHAHRMRALVDGVMIGAATALTDDPRLTVRHVDGPHPHRIVLCGSGRVLQRRDLQVFAEPGCFVVTSANVHAATGTPATTRLVRVPQATTVLDPGAILLALREHGVRSIYLEGGARSLSSFLHGGHIDLLQVHIAAMVLGSGLSSFLLPPVDHVRHGRSFVMDHAALDGHVLLSCWPMPGKPL